MPKPAVGLRLAERGGGSVDFSLRGAAGRDREESAVVSPGVENDTC